MLLEHRSFWLPKDVGKSELFQDAFAVDEVRGAAAIADGVSASLFSGKWAKILTEAIVANPPDFHGDNSFLPWLAEQRAVWQQTIDTENLAWHQKAKLQQGSHSTLLWLHLLPSPGDADSLRLVCWAIGDTCLFHARGSQMLRVFPIEESRIFDEDPHVLCSVPHKFDTQLQFHALDDTCRDGDLLVLCTDAMAAWALQQLEGGATLLWQSFWDMSQDDWAEHIGRLRSEQRIRYDDTTLLLLRVRHRAARRQQSDWVDQAKDTATRTWQDAKGWLSGFRKKQ